MDSPETQEGRSGIPELLGVRQFRDRLRDAIHASGLTQKRVAEELDMRPATVSDWFTSEGTANLPEGETLLRLAGILRVNHHWLWTGQGDMRAAPGDADVLLAEWRRQAADPQRAAAEIRARQARPESPEATEAAPAPIDVDAADVTPEATTEGGPIAVGDPRGRKR